MLNRSSPLAALLAAPVRPGVVTWIGLRPQRHAPMMVVDTAKLEVQQGLVGDHYKSATRGTRHLTLIQDEDLAAIASYLGLPKVPPESLRRNVVVRGINLLALKDKRFRLGQSLLETTGECHPCSRMEASFGPGGYNAVRGHGGITARVVEGGTLNLGDTICVLP